MKVVREREQDDAVDVGGAQELGGRLHSREAGVDRGPRPPEGGSKGEPGQSEQDGVTARQQGDPVSFLRQRHRPLNPLLLLAHRVALDRLAREPLGGKQVHVEGVAYHGVRLVEGPLGGQGHEPPVARPGADDGQRAGLSLRLFAGFDVYGGGPLACGGDRECHRDAVGGQPGPQQPSGRGRAGLRDAGQVQVPRCRRCGELIPETCYHVARHGGQRDPEPRRQLDQAGLVHLLVHGAYLAYRLREQGVHPKGLEQHRANLRLRNAPAATHAGRHAPRHQLHACRSGVVARRDQDVGRRPVGGQVLLGQSWKQVGDVGPAGQAAGLQQGPVDGREPLLSQHPPTQARRQEIRRHQSRPVAAGGQDRRHAQRGREPLGQVRSAPQMGAGDGQHHPPVLGYHNHRGVRRLVREVRGDAPDRYP